MQKNIKEEQRKLWRPASSLWKAKLRFWYVSKPTAKNESHPTSKIRCRNLLLDASVRCFVISRYNSGNQLSLLSKLWRLFSASAFCFPRWCFTNQNFHYLHNVHYNRNSIFRPAISAHWNYFQKNAGCLKSSCTHQPTFNRHYLRSPSSAPL